MMSVLVADRVGVAEDESRLDGIEQDCGDADAGDDEVSGTSVRLFAK